MNSPAQDWLEKRGCSGHVVRLGSEGCVHAWELTARELAEGWNLDFDDYLNDLDDRQIVFEMEQAGLLDDLELKRIHLADHSFRASTAVTDECVWGTVNASEKGWSNETNWWYWRKPL